MGLGFQRTHLGKHIQSTAGTQGRLLLSPRHAKAAALTRRGSRSGGAAETEALLPHRGSQRGPLLRAIWQVFRATFLLGTLSLVISDVFRFTVPKLLRWVQALGASRRVVVPSQGP